MRIAGLATFRKLWGRNDADGLRAGRWRIEAFMSECSRSLFQSVEEAQR